MPTAAELLSSCAFSPAPSFGIGFSFFIPSCEHYCNTARRRSSFSKLNARRRKDRKYSSGSRRKRIRKDNRNDAASIPSVDNLEIVSRATKRPPASLAGVIEDHRYEQFFYDDATAKQLYQIVDLYERPLLMCNPTLAVIAQEKGKTYKVRGCIIV